MGDGEFKQPWLYGEGKAALETPMQAEIYSNSPEMESQWKQPWRAESYPKMEAEMAWPGMPQYPQPPGYYGYPGGDCSPKGDAVGGGSDPCQPGITCGQWIFTCAHRITGFNVLQDFGWIQGVNYGANDTVIVTVCWNEADREAGRMVGPKAVMANGQEVVAKVDLSACCPDKEVCAAACGGCAALAITGYSSQQMSCGFSQIFIASGGAGQYTWSITLGGGTLDRSKGPSVMYTAPATNVNCDLNPTIQLKDCCGITTTLQLAVNCAGPGGPAYRTIYDVYPADGCDHQINQQIYDCEGSEGELYNCDSCGASAECQVNCCFWNGVACVPIGGFCCTQAEIIARCSACATCALGTSDIRTAEQKTAGCCPVALL